MTDPEGSDLGTVLADLAAVIEARQETLPEDSYTASLFTHEKGPNAALEKVGEESTEVLLAAKDGDHDELVAESADLLYHLLVVFAQNGVDLDEVAAELDDR